MNQEEDLPRIRAYPLGTVLGWQDEFYYGLARKRALNEWEFGDRTISDAELFGRLWSASSWTELVPRRYAPQVTS